MRWEGSKGGPDAWVPATCGRGSGGILESWLQPSPDLAVVAI